MIRTLPMSVLDAARDRIFRTFDAVDRPCVSLSGGKDSTVLLHLVMDEAIRRQRKVGVLIIDLEAQYKDTVKNLEELVEQYRDHIDLHWVCPEMLLRNATSVFEPQWVCWDESKKDTWVRQKPKYAADVSQYDFYQPRLEFEEFVPLFGAWYARGGTACQFVGIRADESLNRYKTIAVFKKSGTLYGESWSTKTSENCYNVYPIYDWKASDIWKYHSKYPDRAYNKVYDKMQMAGVPIKHQRLCQPYGDTQRRGLWLYSVLEADTWSKLIARVIGANSFAIYSQDTGNITGDGKITKPDHLTWEQYAKILLNSLPRQTAEHYAARIRRFIGGWKKRGYEVVPDSVDRDVESTHFAPSWRRICRTLLRNDYWCKGLGFSQPKSEAYGKYLQLKGKSKRRRRGNS